MSGPRTSFTIRNGRPSGSRRRGQFQSNVSRLILSICTQSVIVVTSCSLKFLLQYGNDSRSRWYKVFMSISLRTFIFISSVRSIRFDEVSGAFLFDMIEYNRCMQFVVSQILKICLHLATRVHFGRVKVNGVSVKSVHNLERSQLAKSPLC